MDKIQLCKLLKTYIDYPTNRTEHGKNLLEGLVEIVCRIKEESFLSLPKETEVTTDSPSLKLSPVLTDEEDPYITLEEWKKKYNLMCEFTLNKFISENSVELKRYFKWDTVFGRIMLKPISLIYYFANSTGKHVKLKAKCTRYLKMNGYPRSSRCTN